MNKIYKKSVVLFFLMFLTFYKIYGQEISISGQLIDSLTRKNLINVKILLLNNDSIIGVSDSNGRFQMNFPYKKYYKRNSEWNIFFRKDGYYEKKTTIIFSNFKSLDWGIIKLSKKQEILDSVIIKSILKVIVNRDTIEYNPLGYNLNINDNVEELLSKIEGIQIINGKITYFGQEINNILVDNKPFFNNNSNLIIKTLPADIVSKVQIYDKKSDNATFTGINDEIRDKTINLKIKDGRKIGQFGNISIAKGSSKTYDILANAYIFKKEEQLSIVGESMNFGKSIFSNDQTIELNPSGFSNNKNIVLSYRNTLHSNLNINSTYRYDSNKKNTFIKEDIINYFPDSVTYKTNQYSEDKIIEKHFFNFNIDFKNANNLIIIKPQISIAKEGANNDRTSLLYNYNANEDSNFLYKNALMTKSNSKTINSNINFTYSHLFNKRLSSFTNNLVISTDNNNQKDSSNSNSIIIDKNDRYLSKRMTNYTGYFLTNNIRYSIPFKKKNAFIFSLNYKFNHIKNTLDVFNYIKDSDLLFKDTIQSNKYSAPIHSLFSGIEYQLTAPNFNGNFSLGENFIVQKYNNAQKQQYLRKYFNLTPKIIFNYKIEQYKTLAFSYSSVYIQPSINLLQPIVSTQDSLVILEGNDQLKQSNSNDFNLNYKIEHPENGKSLTFDLKVGNVKNEVQNSITQNSNGIQYIKPINTNGSFYFNPSINIYQRIIHNRYAINYMLGFYYNKHALLLNDLQINSNSSFISSITNLRVNNKYLDLIITSNTQIHFTNYHSQMYSNSYKYYIETISLNSKYKSNKNIFIGAIGNVSYYKNTNGSSDFERPNSWVKIINAYIVYQLLKNKNGEVKLSINDLLNESRNLSIGNSLNKNYMESTISQGRIFSLSFIYNFKHF